HLVQRVLELARLVRRVDVDEDGARTGCGVLGDDAFEAIRRPDADAVALLDPAREQAASREAGELPELRVRRAEALLGADERLTAGEALDGAPEASADRLLEQRHRRGAARIRGCRLDRGRHRSSVPRNEAQ